MKTAAHMIHWFFFISYRYVPGDHFVIPDDHFIESGRQLGDYFICVTSSPVKECKFLCICSLGLVMLKSVMLMWE